jgi:hypothetical protein
MSDSGTPENGILDAILNLHAFTERGLGMLDAKIDGIERDLGAKIDGLGDSLRFEMNKRFDRVDQRFDRVDERFDRLEARVARLEHDRA